MKFALSRSWFAAASLFTLTLAALPAHALFKVVGPDGKITYSDRPPPGDTRAVQVNRDGSIASSEASLPFALRQVMAKFPVVLYTASKCEACDMGRALLQRRGIPFAERTATTNEDKEVWEKTTGGQEAPVMKIGAQVMRGFNASAWEETLDVAGYSRTSQLPPNYKAAAPLPLGEPKTSAKPPITTLEAEPAPAPIDPQSNPRGIRF